MKYWIFIAKCQAFGVQVQNKNNVNKSKKVLVELVMDAIDQKIETRSRAAADSTGGNRPRGAAGASEPPMLPSATVPATALASMIQTTDTPKRTRSGTGAVLDCTGASTARTAEPSDPTAGSIPTLPPLTRMSTRASDGTPGSRTAAHSASAGSDHDPSSPHASIPTAAVAEQRSGAVVSVDFSNEDKVQQEMRRYWAAMEALENQRRQAHPRAAADATSGGRSRRNASAAEPPAPIHAPVLASAPASRNPPTATRKQTRGDSGAGLDGTGTSTSSTAVPSAPKAGSATELPPQPRMGTRATCEAPVSRPAALSSSEGSAQEYSSPPPASRPSALVTEQRSSAAVSIDFLDTDQVRQVCQMHHIASEGTERVIRKRLSAHLQGIKEKAAMLELDEVCQKKAPLNPIPEPVQEALGSEPVSEQPFLPHRHPRRRVAMAHGTLASTKIVRVWGHKVCAKTGRRSTLCPCCKGGSLCDHGRQKYKCKECKGSSFCEHGTQRSRCVPCKGSGICEHTRERWRCQECKAKLVAEYHVNKQRGFTLQLQKKGVHK